jgi:rhodanese-related sulfurtransferase
MVRGEAWMPTTVTWDEVVALLAREAQLVDALPAEEYAASHLPEAINIPISTSPYQHPH